MATDIATYLALWTGAMSWTICLLYTIFGIWYASLVGWVMFSMPFQFGMMANYVALRRLNWIPPESTAWVSVCVFGLSAISTTAFLFVLFQETQLIPVLRTVLASMDHKD